MLSTDEKPTGPYFVVDSDKDEINQILGACCYGPNWVLSTKFSGEVVNLARRHYHFDPETEIDWWQVHVRGWTGDDGYMYLRAHYEPDPAEFPGEHVDETGVSVEHGMNVLQNTLEDCGVTIRKRINQLEK